MKFYANIYAVTGLAFCAVLIAYALSAVNMQMEVRTEPETYGWNVAFAMVVITLFPFIMGYLAGRKDKE